MPRQISEDEIARLYQLPLAEFTPARNALAKEAGPAGTPIRQLEKPSLAAWAVNQLFWRARDVYDALVTAADALRAGYHRRLAGKSADVDALEAAHRTAVRDAVRTLDAVLQSEGEKPSDAVRTAIRETLDLLPGGGVPGRLTRPVQRTGFEALQGFSGVVVPQPRPARSPAAGSRVSPPAPRPSDADQQRRKMDAERLRFAEAAEREAEAALERARRAMERASGVRQRLADELAEATRAEAALRKDEAARRAAYDKAVAERKRLSK